MTVAFVVVSHVARLADGVVELAAQMAPGVPFETAGGTDDGGIGTSYERIEAACNRALAASGGDGAVILYDLGSAVMTTETYLEFLDDDERARLRLVDAPLVEGAVAAAVEAAGGGDLDAVARVAEAAWGRGDPASADVAPVGDEAGPDVGTAEATREVEIVNPQGMHARPAAMLAKLAAGYDAEVTIGGAAAGSILALLGLGLTRGDRTEVRATGRDAAAAVDAVAEAFSAGFGELEDAGGPPTTG